MNTHLLTVICLAFAAGVWFAGLYYVPLAASHIVCFLLFVASGWCLYKDIRKGIWVLAGLFFVIGILRFCYWTSNWSDLSLYAGRTAVVQGTIYDIPQVNEVNGNELRVKYTVKVDSFECEQKFIPVKGFVSVSVRQDKGSYVGAYNDKIAVSGRVEKLYGYKNPGLYNGGDELKRVGITARLIPTSQVVIESPDRFKYWQKIIFGFRQQIVERIRKVMAPNDAALLIGMLFGGYTGIKPGVIADFATTGLVHILSVSGSHIALVGGTVLWAGARLGVRYVYAAFLAVLSILLYSMLSGFSPPVVRSCVMGLAALGAVIMGREKDAPSALAAAALWIIFFEPAAVYNLSFQLSFFSTAGIVYFFPPVRKRLCSVLPRTLADVTAVTFCAQIGVLPFVAWYFNSFSLSSFIANLIVLPIVEIVIVMGLAAVVMGLIFQTVGNVVLVAAGMLIGAAVQLTSLLALLPAAKVYVPSMGLWAGAVYYGLLVFMYTNGPVVLSRISRALRDYRIVVGAIALLLTGACYLNTIPSPMYVHHIDVGQGDATLVITPHGRAILIDTGGTEIGEFDVGARVVVPYLRHYGVRQIDYLILTHGHQDHAGGAAAIAAEMPVKYILLPRETYTQPTVNLFKTARYSTIMPMYTGQEISIDGILLKVIYSPDAQHAVRGNESSAVLKICYNSYSFLITGDAEHNVESKIMASSADIKSTVLKVGHHGSKTSTSQMFLDEVNPRYAVISVGNANKYGHPSDDTVRRLKDRNIEIFRTDLHGAVVFKVDNRGMSADTYVKTKQ